MKKILVCLICMCALMSCKRQNERINIGFDVNKVTKIRVEYIDLLKETTKELAFENSDVVDLAKKIQVILDNKTKVLDSSYDFIPEMVVYVDQNGKEIELWIHKVGANSVIEIKINGDSITIQSDTNALLPLLATVK